MPVIGRVGNMVRLVRDPIGFLGVLHGRYGRIAAITRHDPTWISALGPEFNQQLLSDARQFTTLDDAGFDPKEELPEDSALSALVKDPIWERRIQMLKMVVPTLHQKALPGYVDRMVSTTSKVLETWRPGQSIDLLEDMRRIAFRIAMSVLIGLDPEQHDGERIARLFREWLRLVFQSSMSFLPPIPLPWTRFGRTMRISNVLMEHARQSVEFKRGHLGNDALSRLIQAEDPEAGRMSEQELVFSAHTLMVFGHQSVPNVLSWILLCLSQHPDALARVQEEVAQVFQGEPPTFEKLGQLQQLQWVINETLRLLPPNVYQRRVAKKRFGLGPFELPRGASVFWSTYYTHRLPSVFPQPNRFDPLRWETAKPTPFEYLPFGYGAHACLGAQFAQTELKIVLAMVLQRFGLQVAPGAKIGYAADPTLRPTGLRMTVQDRDTPLERRRAEGPIHDLLELV